MVVVMATLYFANLLVVKKTEKMTMQIEAPKEIALLWPMYANLLASKLASLLTFS